MFEDENAPPPQLFPCHSCGRSFNAKAMERHSKVCKKINNNTRKAFDSKKQRHVVDEFGGFTKKKSDTRLNRTNQIKKQPAKSSWKEKHENFIKTIKQARNVTAAIKQGKPLPPVSPPTINPDYIQCPHCSRRFNKTSAERHINFCAEQKKRIGNQQKKSTNMKARTQYKPPKLKKPPKIPPRDPDVRKNGVNGVRFSEVGNEEGNGGVGNVNGLNGNGRKLNGRTGSRRNPPAWDNTVDVSTQGEHRSRTGLKFVPSSRGPMNQKKPVRKVNRNLVEEDTNRAVPYYSDVKTRKTSSIRKYKFEEDAYLAGINQPNQYLAGINQPNQVKRSNTKKKLSANCNECGSDYPVERARFCCMCGVKRLYVDV